MAKCQNGGFEEDCKRTVLFGVQLAFWRDQDWKLGNERKMCLRHTNMEKDFHKDITFVEVLVRPLDPSEQGADDARS